MLNFKFGLILQTGPMGAKLQPDDIYAKATLNGCAPCLSKLIGAIKLLRNYFGRLFWEMKRLYFGLLLGILFGALKMWVFERPCLKALSRKAFRVFLPQVSPYCSFAPNEPYSRYIFPFSDRIKVIGCVDEATNP